MKMYHKQTSILIILLIILLPFYNSHSVCDLSTLQMELEQDLADNGMLDCLRVIDPPHFVEESEIQKNLRLSAQWDSSCSFEADNDWMQNLSKNLEINQLVDSIGDPVKQDFDDQADICEIVRAALAKNKFNIKDINLQNIPKDEVLKGIDCVGTNDKKGTRICAATSVSYYQRDSWTIFLGSSFIKFGKSPNFIKIKPKKKTQKSERSSTDNLLKSLLKLGKKALLQNEAKVAGMIDKEVNEEQEPDHQKEKSRIVHVHLKRTTTSTITPGSDFKLLQGGNFKFKLDESRLIFSFYMLSFKLAKPGYISFKFSYNGREVAETRQSLGLVTEGSLTSAFAEVYNPSGKDVQLGILYDSSSEGVINSSSYDHNLTYGSITLPLGAVFKHINSRNLVFLKTESWTSLQSFGINMNVVKEAYYLVLYNFSIKFNQKGTLFTRLQINGKSVKETSIATGLFDRAGSHSARVVKFNKGNQFIKCEYKFDGEEDITINDFTNPKYVQSIVAFELPPNTHVKNYALDRSISLNTNGGYKPFGFNANVKLDQDKTILIIFNVNLKANSSFFGVRVRMGSKFNRKSVISMKNMEYGRGVGYVVRVLKKGVYKFDLDYKTDSKESYNPETADAQNVSMQIIEMD